MTQFLKYLYRNLFDVILLIFAAMYVVINFDRSQTALAFVFVLIIFLGFPILTIALFYYYFENNMFKKRIQGSLSVGIAVVALSALLLYFVSNWKIFSTFLIGGLLLSAFYFLIMVLRKK